MYTIIDTEFAGGLRGDSILFDNGKISSEYRYLGLWYARDGSEDTLITTEIYRGEGAETALPDKFSEEIKENTFKQVRRVMLPLKHRWTRVAFRVDNDNYCKMRADMKGSGHIYINYRTIRNKSTGVDTLDKGIIKGGSADYFRLGIEDLKGREDYADTIMYVVMMRDYPPADWDVHQECLGVQNVPVLVSTTIFTADRKYSDWLGQNPLKNISAR